MPTSDCSERWVLQSSVVCREPWREHCNFHFIYSLVCWHADKRFTNLQPAFRAHCTAHAQLRACTRIGVQARCRMFGVEQLFCSYLELHVRNRRRCGVACHQPRPSNARALWRWSAVPYNALGTETRTQLDQTYASIGTLQHFSIN